MGASYAESAPATAIWCIDSFALVVTGDLECVLLSNPSRPRWACRMLRAPQLLQFGVSTVSRLW